MGQGIALAPAIHIIAVCALCRRSEAVASWAAIRRIATYRQALCASSSANPVSDPRHKTQNRPKAAGIRDLSTRHCLRSIGVAAEAGKEVALVGGRLPCTAFGRGSERKAGHGLNAVGLSWEEAVALLRTTSGSRRLSRQRCCAAAADPADFGQVAFDLLQMKQPSLAPIPVDAPLQCEHGTRSAP